MSEAHIEPTDELAQFLGDLEASEINGEITLSWMYDRLWTVRIGALGDYHAEGNFKSLAEAMSWPRDKVIELYPESEFTKRGAPPSHLSVSWSPSGVLSAAARGHSATRAPHRSGLALG